ncbi:hypothetical protein Y032_0007g3258 [Ancylostoma ceylanicum]|uniref:Histone acetyltransferase n=1 Tax=Ancylostoma ceylanicum TaxID=53326 RepID=A0A016VLM9_9BILA|nr:hypothetical protein Y032_0007g3258 [Ancylostoma ceylanicum]
MAREGDHLLSTNRELIDHYCHITAFDWDRRSGTAPRTIWLSASPGQRTCWAETRRKTDLPSFPPASGIKASTSSTTPSSRKGRSEKVKLKGRRKTLSGGVISPKTKSDGKSSPIKTRLLLQKSKPLNLSRCTLCKSSTGDLHPCMQCHKLYHLQQCILYPAVMASNAKNGSWLCPKCILCAACNLMIDDPSNVECTTCLRAWHGACMPAHGKVVDRRWYCKQCANAPGLSGSPRKIRSQKRASSPVETPSSEIADDVQATPRKRGRKRESGKYSLEGGPSTSFSPLDTVSSSKDDGSLAILKARDELNNAIIAADQSQRESSRSPRKKTYEKAIPHFLEEDAELFEKALSAEESLASVKEESEKQVNEQWVNLGGETDMKVLYSSPYPENIKNVPLFFVCPFCLKPFSERNSFFVHQDHCLRITPPGREIYRDSTSSLSFFEVDGAKERTYCRNLCLLAMQFLAWKTRHSEVATFLFYVLTRNDEDGCRIVGYFSKEKNPSKNYNLSCLLTLPSEQRNGYGQLLIDMSYQLSRMERKVGGPERPLSDRGLLTYRKYWRSSILCYLRSLKDAHSISLKNMSLATRIHPTDIVNQLLHDNLLVMKDENYYFRTWKRAYKLPLSMLRRRVVDPARINWTPKFDVTVLDPFKLNCYI